MKRLTWTLGIVAVACVANAIAQPPGGPGGPGGRGGPGGGPGGMGGRPPNPVIEVLDADHDHVISADELKNATRALLTLDKNNDGKLTENEFAPQGGPGGPGGGRGQGGGGRAGGANGRRMQSGAPDGPGGPGGQGPGGGPGDGPPSPNPERMVEHAMEFDANKDGKLSKSELTKFAEDFAKRNQGPEGPPGGPGSEDGERPERPKRPD